MSTIRAFLGGSFDPVHDGHLNMATAVHQTLTAHRPTDIIQVALLPTAGNPFKGNPTPAHHRLAMLDLAVSEASLLIDTHEICQTPPTYTIDTVKFFKTKYPNDRLIFILGQDSLVALPTWKDSDGILALVDIWAFYREGEPNEFAPRISTQLTDNIDDFLAGKHKIYLDPTPIATISSSQIRHDIRQGNRPMHLPKKVADYIKTHALYRQT